MEHILKLPKGKLLGRARAYDMLTYDMANAFDSNGNQIGKRFSTPMTSHDGQVYDSTGAFMNGELERLDPTIHEPLVDITYSRDIDMRTDVSLGDEVTSFTLSTFASAGGLGTGNGVGNGKAWSGRNTTEISSASVDISKTANPLRPWSLELKYTIFELESAMRLGRPVDAQKFSALQLKHQMDIDEQIYFGDTTMGDLGLLNQTVVPATSIFSVPNGAGGSPLWVNKTPPEILNDFNLLLTTVWRASGYAFMPNRILMNPANFGYLSTALISSAGSQSILSYVLTNNITTTSGLGQLQIYPCKWCSGMGVGGTQGIETTPNRMIAYTKRYELLRYPMTMVQRTPIQYDGIYHKSTYLCKLGRVEVVYPETVGYADGM